MYRTEITFEIFKKFVLLKLRTFAKRRTFSDLSSNWLWKLVYNKTIKNLTEIFEDLQEEGQHPLSVTVSFLIFYGKIDFILTVLLHVLGGLILQFFPFMISDFIYDSGLFFWENPLITILLIPFVTSFFLFFIPVNNFKIYKHLSFYSSLLSFFFTLFLCGRFDLSSDEFQFVYAVLVGSYYDDPAFYINFTLGIDGLSLTLCILTNFLFLLCFWLNWNSVYLYSKENNIAFQILQGFILFSFLILNIYFFFIFFEATLIPLFIIIGVWGGRERKIYAAYKLFFFTLVSSLLTLIGIIILYLAGGSGDYLFLINSFFSFKYQQLLWCLFFLSFAVKFPMIPFHLWLPEAHVEAPTAGSVILAGVLLKLGGYGFFRFLIPLFPEASIYFAPLVIILSLSAIVYASIIAIIQVDLKKLIAYSSIAHMGFVTFASVNYLNELNLSGALYIMISHGIISSALFICVGILYDRYKTKLIFYYKGLTTTMPLFSTFFFIFNLANIGFPGTSGFIGEFLVLTGMTTVNFLAVLIATLNAIFSVVYSLWMFNRVCFGVISTKYIPLYQDLTIYEFFPLFFLGIITIAFGIFPQLIFNYIEYFIFDFSSNCFLKIKSNLSL